MNFTNEVNGRLLYALHSIFEQGANRANNRIGDTEDERRDRCVRKDGGYKCIHLPPEHFCCMLGQVLEHRQIVPEQVHKLKFIDVGCGVGEKIYLAKLFGMDCYGLELREELIAEGKKLLLEMGFGCGNWCEKPNVDDRFIHANALTYNYKDFDILYFYCPLVDSKLQEKLEARIAKTAKVGAVVIPANAHGCFGWDERTYPKGWQSIRAGSPESSNSRYFIRES